MEDSIQYAVDTVLILLLVIFVVAVLVQRIRLPYTVALVLAGLFGFRPGFHSIQLTPDLILLVFLPILLFEGAYNVSARRLRQNIVPIGLMAVPGVLVGTLVTGALVAVVLNMPWSVGLLFGALIASTDPIAVVALFRDLGAPPRLALLVEGESLLNDGTSITLFGIVLLAIETGSLSVGLGLLRFVTTVAGALLVGTLVGYGGSRLVRVVDNAQAQMTATVVAAYGAYLAAEYFDFSGAIAVVIASLFFGNYGTTGGLTPRAVNSLSATWDFLGFVANSLIFLLIGIALDPLTLLRDWWVIAIAFGASLVGRAFSIYLLLPWLGGRNAIPRAYRPVLLWGGLRGAVSLALVLSVPLTLPGGEPFPQRDTLQLLAFGVVGASLLVQGLTMPALVRRLGLSEAASGVGELALAQARLQAVDGALLVLERAAERGEISGLHKARLANAYQLEHAQLTRQVQTLEQAEA